MDDRAARLRNVPLFSRCSRRELGRLADRTRSETVDAGHVLFTEGAPATNLYVIVAGTATISRGGEFVGSAGPGDVVGELGVVLGRERTATVTAETPIEWLVMDRDSLRAAFDDVPGLGWNVLLAVAERLDDPTGASPTG